MKQFRVAKEIKHRFSAIRGHGPGFVRVCVRRAAPEVGPAAPRWEAVGEVTLVRPSMRGAEPVTFIVRAVAKRLERLSEAWTRAFKATAGDFRAAEL